MLAYPKHHCKLYETSKISPRRRLGKDKERHFLNIQVSLQRTCNVVSVFVVLARRNGSRCARKSDGYRGSGKFFKPLPAMKPKIFGVGCGCRRFSISGRLLSSLHHSRGELGDRCERQPPSTCSACSSTSKSPISWELRAWAVCWLS